MNLRNICLGDNIGYFPSNHEEQRINFPFNKGYMPVCNLPCRLVNGDTNYHLGNNYDFFEYALAKFYYNRPEKKEYFDNATNYYENSIITLLKCNLNNDNVGFSMNHYRNMKELKYMFFNTFGTIDYKRRKYISVLLQKNHTIGGRDNCLIIARGAIFLYKNNRIIPLIVLMVENNYAEEFIFSSIVDYKIDTNKLEWWVNPDIENLDTAKIIKIEQILKGGDNGGIKVLIKGNMNEYFSSPTLPNFKSITDRLKFFNNLKTNFINRDSGDEIVLDVPKIEMTNIHKEFKSKIIRQFTGQEKSNKYKLIE